MRVNTSGRAVRVLTHLVRAKFTNELTRRGRSREAVFSFKKMSTGNKVLRTVLVLEINKYYFEN